MENEANTLLLNVLNNDLFAIRRFLNDKQDSKAIFHLATYSFNINQDISALRGHKLISKLQSCSVSIITPFHMAAALGSQEIVELFILRGVPVDTQTKDGIMAIHLVSFFGHKNMLKTIINDYNASINIPDQYGWTCLHFASTEGVTEIVRILLDNGADVEKRDKDGTTALYRAQVAGHPEIVELLLGDGEEEDLERLMSVETEDGESLIPMPDIVKDHLDSSGYMIPKDIRRRHSVPKNFPDKSNVDTKRRSKSPSYSQQLPVDGEPINYLRQRLHKTGITSSSSSSSRSTLPKAANLSKPKKEMEVKKDENRSSLSLMDIIRQELKTFKENEAKLSRPLNYVPKVPKRQPPAPPNDLPPDDEEVEIYEDPYSTIGGGDDNDDDDEDPYSTIADVLIAAHKTRPDPPTIRNRLPISAMRGHPNNTSAEEIRRELSSLSILQDMSSSEALRRACFFISIRVGDRWTLMGKALGLSEKNIDLIKSEYHYDGMQQCAVAFKRWQEKRDRSVDDLVIVLRESGLQDMVVEVQEVVQEFTA